MFFFFYTLCGLLYRQEKEAWIKAKYVEKKFLKKLGSTEILINGERKSERRWSVKKCRRHNSATTVPKTRRRYRQEPGSTSPSTLSAGTSVVLGWSLDLWRMEAKSRAPSLADNFAKPDHTDTIFIFLDSAWIKLEWHHYLKRLSRTHVHLST